MSTNKAKPTPPPARPRPVYTNKQLEHVLLDSARATLSLLLKEKDACRSTCVECLHFDDKKELCTVAHPHRRPPAQIIAYGCELFEYIPF